MSSNTQTGLRGYFTTERMTAIAILTALAAILGLIPGIPLVNPYKIDFAFLPALLGSFALGPIAGVIILGLSNLIALLNSSTGGVGELANFIMGMAFVLPASLIYQRKKTENTALLGMCIGTLVMVIVSIFVNKWIMFPLYLGTKHDMNWLVKVVGFPGADSEWKILMMVTAPFNLVKGIVVSLITYVVYKPLSPIIKGTIFTKSRAKR